MRRCGHLEVSGDLLAYHRHLLLLEMIFTPAERQETRGSGVPGEPYIEAVTGHYLNLDIGGRHHRIYFEEAGSGPALLCLHTAGSDARQYRHVLNDPEVTSHFRVIAFDMPWHGKSSPPHGFESEVYSLTTERYVELVMAVKRALALDKPVVMGCSIGGRVVLHLALRHGDELDAVIGLQSALYAEDRTGNTEDATRMVLHRPDVHSNQVAGALMNGVMAPQSPTHERWETMWHYMQGGPGVFAGDLDYYFTDGDLRNGSAAAIDVAKCPVYLLSGEYDPSATPEMGQSLAEEIGATYFEVMNDMGHFPMSENPDGFRAYLLRVLAMIQAQ
jgi:pimeloyl-ACP methyl ester carboxylesterase